MPLKILFISKGDSPDYLNDCFFHGLHYLSDIEVYSNSNIWFMYSDIQPARKANLYGKGFTVYGRLDAGKRSTVVSRINIYRLIFERYFDLVVYGSIWRCSKYLSAVKRFYDPNQIIFLDGEDHQKIHSCASNGIYFKRENVVNDENIHPISFGIPEELVVEEIGPKTQYWATVIPGNLETYIFSSEKDYFTDYHRSRFAITTKKAGWDCLRHYEILMNGCVPYFPFLENCPPKTMANFPKAELIECFQKINDNSCTQTYYEDTANILLEYTRKELTTKKLAADVLSFANSHQGQ